MVGHFQLCALLLQVAPLLTLAGSTIPVEDIFQLQRRAPPTCTIQNVTPPGPPPNGFYCNQQGTIRNPAIISSTPRPTFESCRDTCLNNQAQCISFSYGPNKRCITYSKTIVAQGFTAGNTGRAFWNRRCFKKVCTCPEGQTNCSNNCADLQSDPANCGACGSAVPSGASCCSGQPADTQTDPSNCGACGAAVSPGDTCCSGQDIDTTSDNNNCGACGNAVTDGQTCCNSQGVDLMTDPANCGACGQAVGEGQTCCSGQAVDTSSDPNNCGACGQSVGEGQTCCNGQGVDLSSDPNNCGSCGNSAGSGNVCCNGSPVSTDGDPNNCGACGNTCGNGASCSSGQCTCPFGQSRCSGPNGPCMDTYSDPNNCGACGNQCSGNVCYHGVCPNCSGDFCSQGAGTPCGTAGGCNCVGIEGSTQYGRCVDVNDGTSCEAFSPRCNTNADCPSGKFCGNYQIACNCARKACFPKGDRCSNNSAASRIFRVGPNVATDGGLTAKGEL